MDIVASHDARGTTLDNDKSGIRHSRQTLSTANGNLVFSQTMSRRFMSYDSLGDGQRLTPCPPSHVGSSGLTPPTVAGDRLVARRVTPLWVIFGAMVIGACLALPMATEQDAVEGALVIAGIVPYDPHSVMGQYYFGVWTLLHQVGALVLLTGTSQIFLDYFYSLAPVALRCGAYAMVIFGFSRRPIFSLIGAIICYASGFLLDSFSAPEYPVPGRLGELRLYSFGAFGYALAAWVVGAVAGGRNILAGFSAAVLIAAHPVIGSYICGITTAVLLFNHFLRLDLPTKGILHGFLAGSPVTLLSLIAYLAKRPAGGVIDHATYDAYMQFWEAHRTVQFYPEKLIPVAMAAVVLAAFCVTAANRQRSVGLASVVLFGMVTAAGLLYSVAHLSPELLPRVLVAAMPSRLLSVHAAIIGAFAVGMAAWTVDLIPAWLQSPNSVPRVGVAMFTRWVLSARPIALVAILAVALFAPAHLTKDIIAFGESIAGRGAQINDTDAFWLAVRRADIKGPVLTSYFASVSALHRGHVQVLLNTTAINFIPYVPYPVKEMARIITRAYGISFTNPPDQPRERIMDERAYWSTLTVAQWAELGREFGIVAVIAPTGWPMTLPALIEGAQFTLYKLPPSGN